MAWLYRLNRCVMPVARRIIPGSVEGAERIPRSGPVLIAANHASFTDPWLIAMRAPQRSYRFVIIASWFDRTRLLQMLFRSWGTIPTNPSAPKRALQRVLEVLENDESVVIFPEGRVSSDGRIVRGKRGIARVAAMSGVPVLPLGISGNFQFLPRHRRVPTWHPVTVRVGRPIPYPGAPFAKVGSGIAGAGPKDLGRFTETVMSEIRKLAGQSSSLSAR